MEIANLILEFIKALIWPLSILTFLMLFKSRIIEFLSRTKKLNLPGGISLEAFDQQIENAKELASEIKIESQSRDFRSDKIKAQSVTPKYSKANERMLKLGLAPSPSGLEISFYEELARKDPRLAIAGLRIELELMLNNLAKGFAINYDENWSISKKVDSLYNQDAIDQQQQKFISIILDLSNSALHGVSITLDQALEILQISRVLIDDYLSWLEWGFSDK